MKSKAIMISAIVAVLCASIVIGASFALFSQETSVETYLSAGTLDATLTRTDLRGQFVENGILSAVTTDETDVVLSDTSNNTNAAFKFGSNEAPVYNVPGVWEEATFELENNGNVAFDSVLKFSYIGEAPSSAPDVTLASKLIVTVSASDTVIKTGTLAEIIEGGAIALNSKQTTEADKKVYVFRIKIELPYEAGTVDDGTGEDTIMNASVGFTFTVTATQSVASGATTTTD